MANVFGILTTLVLLAAGFVALKNKAAYEREIGSVATEKKSLSESKGRLKSAEEGLAATIAQRTEMESELVTLTNDETAQKKTNAEIKTQIDAKSGETAANKTKLDEIRDKTAKVGDLKELASKMRATNSELEELSQNITATEAKLANLTATGAQAEAQVVSLKKKFEGVSAGQSLPTLNTRIRSIYPTWGFVTLGTGNSGGVVSNSTLDVVRDGAVVAQLLVTAVERNSASASIVPDSIAQDVTLMVGDRVIPAQKSAQN